MRMPQYKNSRSRGGGGGLQHQQHQADLVEVEGAMARLPANPALPSGQVYCCVPMGCNRLHEEPINVGVPGDSVKVACNNEGCTEGTWMHGDCFVDWQEHVLCYLRSCGRARSWSEKQRLQNLWTKKGYDLAYKACDCKCGRGHLRKDLDYIPPRVAVVRGLDDKKGKKPRKKNEKPLAMLNKAVGGPNHHQIGLPQRPTYEGGSIVSNRPQLRVRTSSFSSTGSASPPSSAGTPPSTPGSGGSGGASKKTQFFFMEPGHAATGNIFRRRTDFSVFNVLPRHQQNPYHIKMEDEGPHGNDETRCFVLTNLSTHQVTAARCVVCHYDMPVFDKYPLIDGTFFLSPQRYNSDLMVLSDHKMLYMNAVCMKCLDGGAGRQLQCRACRSPWLGSAFVIGSMYAYDIFAAMPCCAQRLSCKNCRGGIMDPGCAFQFFSEYSKPIQCPHCKVEDFHFIKPLDACFSTKSPIRKF